MSKLKLVALILLVLSGALIIYGNPWDSTDSSHYVPPPKDQSGSSAKSLTDLTGTDWVYKVTGPDDSTSVQVQNLGDVVYFELDATAPNYVWGNILVLYDKTKLASVSLEENPDNWSGFWTWWTYATGQSTYGGGGNYYYYDYVAGTSIANQGSQWAQDWVNNYGGGGPVGTIDPDYGSILDPNSADYQTLVNKGIGNISNLGAIRLYTSTYAGGMNNNSPLRLGFQVISTGNSVFNVFSDDATSYNWHPSSLPWHLQSSVALTLAPPPCPNMQSDTKTEYGSTVTISGPIEVFTNQPYLINLSAQTDAPIYQWNVTENSAYKDGQGFVWGNQFEKTLMFAQPTVGDYTYTFNYRGIMGAHGWPPYTAVSITVTVKLAPPTIEDLIAQIDQYYQAGQIKNQGIYNSLISKIDAIEKSLSSYQYNSALGGILALRNSVQSQTGKGIDTTEGNILVDLIWAWYQQIILDNFYADLPTVFTFDQLDNVTVTIPSYPYEQEITISGVFQHVFYRSSENPNLIYSLMSNLQSKSTPLFVPGIGYVELEIARDKTIISYGTICRNRRKFFWEMNALVTIVGTNNTIPVKFVIEDDISFTETGTMYLSASGSGVIDESVPIFGGAVFSFMPGSGPSTTPPPSKSPDNSPSKKTFKTYLEMIAEILANSGNSVLASIGEILNGILRTDNLAKITDEDANIKIDRLYEVYKAISNQDEDAKIYALIRFFQELEGEGLITSGQYLTLHQRVANIAAFLDEVISKEEADKITKQIEEFWKNQQQKQQPGNK